MSHRDPFALHDAFSAVRDQMERWVRLPRVSAIESALTASQEVTQRIDTLMGRSLAAQVAEAAAAVRPASEALTTKTDMLLGRSLAAQVAEATASAPRNFEDLTAKMDMLGDLTRPVSDLEEQLTRAAAMLPPPQHFDQISALDRMVRSSLDHIDWERLHGAFHFGDELARLTGDLTAAYRDLALQTYPSGTPFTLDTLPAIELYAHANLLGILGHLGATAPVEADEEETEESRIREEIDERSQVTLESLLARYDPDLLELWRAADEGLTNEYYAALKFCSAQRELLRKLLQKAAPDSAVQQWATDPKYISQRGSKLVTMSGRIAYVCNRACLSGYTHFAITDRRAAAEVWSLLNTGAHQVPSRLTRRQVSELRIRSNCLILMTLQLVIKATN